MELPKFLLADNSALKEDIFVLHTEFPRFILNLATDEIEILDDVEGEDEAEMTTTLQKLVEEAGAFYDAEMEHYEKEEEF